MHGKTKGYIILGAGKTGRSTWVDSVLIWASSYLLLLNTNAYLTKPEPLLSC